MIGKRMVTISQEIICDVIDEGDIVVDATVGKGNDTIFLAKKVGKKGKVFGFDIQEEAIQQTTKKIEEANLNADIELIKDSHANIDKYVQEQIKVCMFNLGYLPGGDESIITKLESTIESIEKALLILKKGGVVSILSYYGHSGGKIEKQGVEKYLKKLSSYEFDVMTLNYHNRELAPPILYIIKRKRNIIID